MNGGSIAAADCASRVPGGRVEQFQRRAGVLTCAVALTGGGKFDSVVAHDLGSDGRVGADEADAAFLRSPTRPKPTAGRGRIHVLDLFSGCGGLSLGLSEASRAVGIEYAATGVDSDPVAGGVFRANLPNAEFLEGDIAEMIDGEVAGRLTLPERSLRARIGEIDILVGGPPCQGHSALNNRTRHDDARNDLYLKMVRAAEVFSPTHVVIENVPGAARDRGGVVQRAAETLGSLGYEVSMAVVDAAEIGVAQRRKRLVVVASRRGRFSFDTINARYGTQRRSLRWAIADLEHETGKAPINQVAASAPATRQRIDYLFDNGMFDLPNDQRPACHAKGGHSYRSIYGRLSWEEPAQTLTTGFYCMCMGRYVHPSQRRTLTAHEAARIQSFPDWFEFGTVTKRGDLARLIGNAVPLKIGYVVGLELLR